MQNQPPSSLEQAKALVRQFRKLALVAIIVIIIGIVFYHQVEHLSWLDASYFTVVSLATVGYGDIVPKTDAGKLFTIFYLFVGLGIFASLVSNLLKNRVVVRHIKKLEGSENEESLDSTQSSNRPGGGSAKQ